MSKTRDYQAVTLSHQGAMACPGCGEFMIEYGDEVNAVGPDHDDYDSPAGTRGGYIETIAYCSLCDTRLSLVIGNHKGALLLLVAPIPGGDLLRR